MMNLDFIADESDNTILPQASKIDRLAGGSYNEHVDEINKKIDDTNRKNAEAYRKASLFTVG